MNPSLIFINPWIYDFAAYDLWSKPLGLLYLAGYLRACGFNVHLIDCLAFHHPALEPGSLPARRVYGTGKFLRERAVRSPALKPISRSYSRYGIPKQLFVNALKEVKEPEAILVTSLMTYWYPGVTEAIAAAREVHPRTPILLGGIYARLCQRHAVGTSGADRVVTDISLPALAEILAVLRDFGIEANKVPSSKRLPLPALDLVRGLDHVPVVTSTGCPYRCEYCASHFLNSRFIARDPLQVFDEILHWHRKAGIRDFAFYDDALLVGFEKHLGPILDALVKENLGLRFHTPNALHVRELSAEAAHLLWAAGFKTIRLGFESSDMTLHRCLDRKLSEGDFERAVGSLLKAGFAKAQVGAYILAGLPGQPVRSVEESVEFVTRAGAMPYLAEYSPIPHTPLWDRAVPSSPYDLVTEPLFHNNTLLPCWNEE
ncbi:MAG: B12-binding domain-containing radical SAM protein, partial [Deltaproteobacteria bacterium]